MFNQMKVPVRAGALPIVYLTVAVGCTQHEAESLRGHWMVTHIGTDGEMQQVSEGYAVSFGEKTFEFTVFSQQTSFGVYALCTTQEPQDIDMELLRGSVGGSTIIRGIYTTDRNSAKLCIVSSAVHPRPQGFVTNKGDGQTLFILKRFDG